MTIQVQPPITDNEPITRRQFVIRHLINNGEPYWEAHETYRFWRFTHPDVDVNELATYREWIDKHYPNE